MSLPLVNYDLAGTIDNLVVVVEFPAPLCPTSSVLLGLQYLAYEASISQLYPDIGFIIM